MCLIRKELLDPGGNPDGGLAASLYHCGERIVKRGLLCVQIDGDAQVLKLLVPELLYHLLEILVLCRVKFQQLANLVFVVLFEEREVENKEKKKKKKDKRETSPMTVSTASVQAMAASFPNKAVVAPSVNPATLQRGSMTVGLTRCL